MILEQVSFAFPELPPRKNRHQLLVRGFLLSSDGLIVTCAHVVEGAGHKPGDEMEIFFHATGEKGLVEVLANWCGSKAEDVAFLQLKGKPPEAAEPVVLGTSAGTEDHPFATFGFPEKKPKKGLNGSGKIGKSIEDEYGIHRLQLSEALEISIGFSGGPVFDKITRRVVGMVDSITEPDDKGRFRETAFITPSELLKTKYPLLDLHDICPFRGLQVFTEKDAEFFFGRDVFIEELLNKLKQEPSFLAVVGPSGSGKSSVVQAGLIPQLKQGKLPGSDRWGIIVSRPADDPFARLLEQGLTSVSENIRIGVQEWLLQHPDQEKCVLVIDQFEELFTSCSEDLCAKFIKELDELLNSDVPSTIILTMRDEFLSNFTRQALNLIEWFERGIKLLPPELGQNELIEIVQKPAEAIGLRFETGLAQTIVKDALEKDNAGVKKGRNTILPLLEVALTQLWVDRVDGYLTFDAYKVCGVTGKLTEWATNVYRGFDEESQTLTLRILTDLVYLGDEDKRIPNTRRRRNFDSLLRNEIERETVGQIVERLVEARLLVSSGSAGRNYSRCSTI